MQSSTDVERLVRQARAYEYADGLREIMLGLLLLFASCFIYLFRGASLETGAIGAVVLAALILASQWVIVQIRSRLTWRRTGYAGFDRTGYRRLQISRVLIGLAIGIPLAFVLTQMTGNPNWITLAAAAFFSVFFITEWQRYGQARWLVLVFSAPLIAILLALAPITRDLAFLAIMLFLALGILLCGLYALVRYLRAAPAEWAK